MPLEFQKKRRENAGLNHILKNDWKLSKFDKRYTLDSRIQVNPKKDDFEEIHAQTHH